MKALKALCVALAMAAGLCGCVPQADTVKVVDAHNSRNSLDWAGVYEGVLPCADCPGIKTRLSLSRDGSFELSTQYLDRQGAPQTVHGKFSWNAAGSAIALDAAGLGQQFRVGEGRLLQLDRDGSVPAPSSHNRVLTQVSTN